MNAFLDLSEDSIECCRDRYKGSKMGYKAEFLVADCTRVSMHRTILVECMTFIHTHILRNKIN